MTAHGMEMHVSAKLHWDVSLTVAPSASDHECLFISFYNLHSLPAKRPPIGPRFVICLRGCLKNIVVWSLVVSTAFRKKPNGVKLIHCH